VSCNEAGKRSIRVNTISDSAATVVLVVLQAASTACSVPNPLVTAPACRTPDLNRVHFENYKGLGSPQTHNSGPGYPFNRSSTSLGQWNVLWPAPTTPSLLGSFGLGSGLMQTAWTTWNGCGGLAASFVRPVVIWEDGGLGTGGSCVLDAVAAHR